MYEIKLSDKAKEDLVKLKKNEPTSFKKTEKLFIELKQHPRSGTGQIEQLKYFKEEIWSRRINKEHRLVYRIFDEFVEVLVLSAFGHYNDK